MTLENDFKAANEMLEVSEKIEVNAENDIGVAIVSVPD